jgi:rsbT co-antagonist protein RsbR
MADDPLAALQAENEALRHRVADLARAHAALESTRAGELQAVLDLDTIFLALPDLYFRMDAMGTIVDYRAGATSDLYAPPSVFMGKRVQDVLPPDVGTRFVTAFKEAFASGAKVRIEYSLEVPAGQEIFEGHIVPLVEKQQMVLLVRKITEQRRAEVALRRMNAELEGSVQDRTASLVTANQMLRTFRALADNSPDAIVLAQPDGAHVYVNASGRALFHIAADADSGQIDIAGRLLGESRRQGLGAPDGEARNHTFLCKRADGTVFQAQVTAFPVEIDGAEGPGLAAFIVRDVTDQLQVETERISLREQIIETQRATLRELSTPLIPLAAHVLAMPLIGSVDSERAGQLIEVLLRGVEKHRARVVLLDITGVPRMDAPVADALVQAAKAVSLLGAQLVLTGIRPEVAQTLVAMRADLGGITTRGSLEQGIAFALGRNR